MDKQQLGRRNTYTPADAPQVRSFVTLSLNSLETDSEQSSKTLPNNPDVGIRGNAARTGPEGSRRFCGNINETLTELKGEKWALENRLARDEARMRALQEGIDELKARMGEMGQ